MRPLVDVRPTPEQLVIISRNRPGTEIIRGAAGSGKTTTALLRLRSLTGMFVNRKRREQSERPVRVLVLTFNRTLRGYIDALAKQQVVDPSDVDLLVSTFAKWSLEILPSTIVQTQEREHKLRALGQRVPLPSDFLLEEVDYVMGRFLPERYSEYLTTRREGRGIAPAVPRSLRERILDEVITPYQEWKAQERCSDWNDLAVQLASTQMTDMYDIVIADETQDFSANQIRAIINHLSEVHSLTLVLDTAQRIYPRGFTWQEAGVNVRPENSKRLSVNYRNTVEIARFATPLLAGVPIDDDGTLPDFSQCERRGTKPKVIKGKFRPQVAYCIDYINRHVDLQRESVAFLHPAGWFGEVKAGLANARLPFVEITRQSEWPEGDENIALSTLHSAKGLEFDHVLMIGLSSKVTHHGEGEDDDKRTNLRRLLAMGISRARNSLIIGYKPEEASTLVRYFEPDTYEEVVL